MECVLYALQASRLPVALRRSLAIRDRLCPLRRYRAGCGTVRPCTIADGIVDSPVFRSAYGAG